MENIFNAAIITAFCILLYATFCRKPRVKAVRAPGTKDIKRKKKRDRRLRKIKRKFRLPYRGRTEIIKFDKTRPYIDSAWNEVERR